MRAQKKDGSVVFNRSRGTWNFLWCEGKKRKSRKLGTLAELPTRSDALKKAERIRREARLVSERQIARVCNVVAGYENEQLPQLRHTTRRVERIWLGKYILAKWGDCVITDLQPRPVQLWLESLELAPKTRRHLRDLLRKIVEYAMWSNSLPLGVNPMSLVKLRGSSKRIKTPRSLTVEEFQQLLSQLREPFRTMVLTQACLGLRVSELLALRWRDVDWKESRLNVEHGIVNQILDSVKTEESQKILTLDRRLLATLLDWRNKSEFSGQDDWIFASPVKIGRLPYSYTGYWRHLQEAARKAGLGRLGTHSCRHTYRSWLDAVGTRITVQRKLMRQKDIRTTLNIYGDVVTTEMQEASAKVAELAIKN